MKPGVRALGIAESYRGDVSTLAGVVVRASRVVDGFAFGSCTVGGTDATEELSALVDRLDREDIRFLFVAGIAPAWFNVIDLHGLHEATEIPVLSVTFEESGGLESAIREQFEGQARTTRLERYRAQPPRSAVRVEDSTVFLRNVGIDDESAAAVVRAFTPEGGRPEPVRVARQAARAADTFRR